jgi:outer membrane protein assembly factor BamB
MRLLTICLAMTAAAAGANWPQFRGPGASGVGDGTLPVKWDGASGKNVVWKTPIPGLGYSSPVVWGDRIFLTSAVPAKGEAAQKLGLYGNIEPVKGEPEQSFNVFCLDRKSGKILWTRTAASGKPRVQRHPKSSHANPTVATDGKYLVAFFGSEGLFTYDLEGKLLWKKDFGVLDAGYFMVPDAQWGFASSPVITGDKLIVQADVQKNSFLAAFELKTGNELWRTPRADVPTFGTPAVLPYTGGNRKSLQVVVNGFKHIGGYDLATGKELWKLKGTGDIPVPTPVLGEGVVIVTSAHGPGRPIYAIRTDASGDITDQPAAMAWKQERSGNYMQTPLVHDGIGYFCLDSGVLSVFKIATGERLYQQRLGGGTAGFTSSPVAAGKHLYITNEEGRTFVLALGGEYKPVGENDLGESVMATPAIVDGVLYMRGGRNLYAIAEK